MRVFMTMVGIVAALAFGGCQKSGSDTGGTGDQAEAPGWDRQVDGSEDPAAGSVQLEVVGADGELDGGWGLGIGDPGVGGLAGGHHSPHLPE